MNDELGKSGCWIHGALTLFLLWLYLLAVFYWRRGEGEGEEGERARQA